MKDHMSPQRLDELIKEYFLACPEIPASDEELYGLLDEAESEEPLSKVECDRMAATVLKHSRDKEQDKSALECSMAEQFSQKVFFDLSEPSGGNHQRKASKSLGDRFAFEQAVIEAYVAAHEGCSIDTVITNPELNVNFIHECWKRGLQTPQRELNLTLLKARKGGQVGRLPTVRSQRIDPARLMRCFFASEVALRKIQDYVYYMQQSSVSIDGILCDPKLAARLDEIAGSLAPGCTSFEYRWAALTLRKSVGRAADSDNPALPFKRLGTLGDVRASSVSVNGGYFWLRFAQHDMYIGHSENLRSQFETLQSLRESHTEDLFSESGLTGTGQFEIAVAETPRMATRVRFGVRNAYVKQLQPMMNVIAVGKSA